MTLGEFNAWLEGYECSFDNGRPTLEQWQKVRERLATVAPIKPAVPVEPALRGGVLLPLKSWPDPLKDIAIGDPKIRYGAGDDPKMMGGAR